MTRTIRRASIALVAILVGVLGLAVPASASWHGTCAPYHDGNLCLFTGFNGAGSMVDYPEAAMTVGECDNLSTVGMDNNVESLDITWVHYAVQFYDSADCSGLWNHVYYGPGRYNVSVENPGLENQYSSFKVLLII